MDKIDAAFNAAANHAAKCRACGRPIVDDEGNPGFFGEACKAGLPLLVQYVSAIGEPVPAWAMKSIA